MEGVLIVMQTVILLFHPDMTHSLVNKKLIERAEMKRNVTVRDMYALYHNQSIDVEEERRILEQADRVVLQFPLIWYDAPYLLPKWAGTVFDDYWLHSGPNGSNILQDKELVLTVAYSEPSYDYTPDGKYKYTLKQILRHFEVMAMRLGMKYCAPYTVYELDDLEEAAKSYAEMLSKEELPVQSLYDK